jgi:hypothetical protein
MHSRFRAIRFVGGPGIFMFVFLSAHSAAAQPAKNGPQVGNASSLPGDNRLLADWPTIRPRDDNQFIVWYKTVETAYSASQPIVLEPMSCADVVEPYSREFTICADIAPERKAQLFPSMPSDKRPLAYHQKLVIAIRDAGGLLSKYCSSILILNVVSQSTTASNPAAERPTQATGGTTGGGGGAAAAAAALGATAAAPLSIVASTPCVPSGTTIPVTVYDSNASPAPAGVSVTFNPGGLTMATDSTGRVLYPAAGNGMVTASATIGAVPITGSFQVFTSIPQTYYLSWHDRLDPDVMLTVSVTGIIPNVAQDPTGSTGQPITMATPTYSHVHSLSSYNVSTGLIYSGLRNPTFTRQESAVAVACPTGSIGCSAVPEQYATVTSPGPRSVDPVLFFTIYAFGKFDAERKWRPLDLLPEPTVGISLSSPTTDYFFGATSEIMRGIQLVGGVHLGKINQLVQPLVSDPSSSSAPTTQLVFTHSEFIGITFNFSFIQGLFGATKGGG